MDKKIKIAYLLLGIGIGLIVASTLYSFYPKVEYMDLSDDIIIEKARELGMVWLKENIDIESINNRVTDEEIGETVKEISEKEIVVESGSSLTIVVKKLYDANLIDDIDEFILFVKDKKLDKKIRTGRYKIKLDSSHDEIIEILTRRPN